MPGIVVLLSAVNIIQTSARIFSHRMFQSNSYRDVGSRIKFVLFILYNVASLNLSPTAQWAQNAATVAGAADGTGGSSLSLLNLPYGITIVDDNTLYVCDAYNNRVVLVQLNSTTATAVIGQGSTSNMYTLNYPTDIFVTRTMIYITDSLNYRVQKWSRNLSNPVTVAGIFGVKGISTDMTTLSRCFALFVDNYANLFVSDFDNNRVMMFPWNSTSGTGGAMVAGTGISGSGINQLKGPYGLFVTDNGVLYIADYNNHRIQKWVLGGTSGVTVAGTGVAGNGLSQFNGPNTILVDLNGYMYITDEDNGRIMRWEPGAFIGECIAGCSGTPGAAANQLDHPNSIAFDSSGSMYVSDWRNNRVQNFQILDEISKKLIY
jgi:sugar lactone lactonase YvrE